MHFGGMGGLYTNIIRRGDASLRIACANVLCWRTWVRCRSKAERRVTVRYDAIGGGPIKISIQADRNIAPIHVMGFSVGHQPI
jgi:hypothetical protein